MFKESFVKSTHFRLRVIIAFIVIFSTLALTSTALAAGPGDTLGDSISDVLMGNEPNIIPFSAGNKGPSEVEPGSIGAGEFSVEGSGAPGPITCGGNWVGVALFAANDNGGQDASLPGDPDAPGMNVDCGTGGSPPHTP